MAGEGGQDEGIVLKKVPGEEVEGKLADMFGDHRVVVRLDPAFGGAQQQGGAFLEHLHALPGRLAFAGQGGVDFRHGDRALRDVDDPAAAAVRQEADLADHAVLRPVEVRGDFRAVVPELRRGNAGLHRELDAGHVLQQLADLAGLPRELGRVGQVLVLAAAAGPEQRAAGLHAVRRGLEHLDQVGVGAVLVVAENAGLHELAGQAERHEDHPAVHPADADAEIAQGIDPQLDLLVVGEGVRVEFFRRAEHKSAPGLGRRGALAKPGLSGRHLSKPNPPPPPIAARDLPVPRLQIFKERGHSCPLFRR